MYIEERIYEMLEMQRGNDLRISEPMEEEQVQRQNLQRNIRMLGLSNNHFCQDDRG